MQIQAHRVARTPEGELTQGTSEEASTFEVHGLARERLQVGLSIGVGFDIRRADLWSFRGNYPLDFYADDMPAACFLEEPCSTALEKKTHNFKSGRSWQQSYAREFGIDASVSMDGFTGSFSLGTGNDFQSGWDRDHEIIWSTIAKNQKCYQFRSSCLTNPQHLSDRAQSLLQELPLNKTGDERVWAITFIQNFGTHVAVKSSHGSMLQATSSTASTCRWSSACRKLAAKARLGFLQYADVSMGGNSSECQQSSACEEATETACAAVGGDPLTSTGLCDKEVTEEQINSFLESGDMQAGSTTIGLKLRPMAEVVMQMGFWEQGLELEKAMEFYACAPPLFEWRQNEDGTGHSCQCRLQCQNGGVLDPHSCSCTCPGNDNHGSTGSDCSKTYGKCVRGVGASDTSTARGRACVEGNTCGGIERSDHCGNTDVCCNRDEGGICCPFGSTCDCFSNGRRFCECRRPEDGPF